jgi:hypothetical protein
MLKANFVVLTVGAAIASGAPIEETETFSSAIALSSSSGVLIQNGVPADGSLYNGTLPLPKFDTQGGTRQLTDVEVNFSLSVSAEAFVRWDIGIPSWADYTGFGNGSPATISVGGSAESFTDTVRSQTFTKGVPDPLRNEVISLDFTLVGDLGDLQPLSWYEGTGTFPLGAEAPFLADKFQTEFRPGTILQVIEDISWLPGGELSAEVTYTFIPSPASAALLGLAGFAAARRRR